MSKPAFVDVRYQEINLGSGLEIGEFSENGAYVALPQPMPVGTSLLLGLPDSLQIEVLVCQVFEQIADLKRPPGMVVRAVDLSESGREWWASKGGHAPAKLAVVSEALKTQETTATKLVTPEQGGGGGGGGAKRVADKTSESAKAKKPASSSKRKSTKRRKRSR